MSDPMQLLKQLEPSVRPVGGQNTPVNRPTPIEGQSFEQIIREVDQNVVRQQATPLKWSAHAQQRLNQRDVALTNDQLQAINESVELADAKGAQNAFVVMGDVGMIVNVPKRIVQAVMPTDRMTSGVITQIDSAVMVDDPHGSNALDRYGGGHRLQL